MARTAMRAARQSTATISRRAGLGFKRSVARTAIGGTLIGAGAFVTLHSLFSLYSKNTLGALLTQTQQQMWIKVGAGGALLGAGILLATVWSDVPVARDLRVAALPGGMVVSSQLKF